MMRHREEFSDTDPRAKEVWLEVLRSKTPGERIEIAFQLRSFGAGDLPALRGVADSPGSDDPGL